MKLGKPRVNTSQFQFTRRVQKKLWLFLSLLNINILVNAQTITIKEKETGEPIEMASLMSDTPSAFATTNKNGQADITAFRGATKIEIHSLGYKMQIKSFVELQAASFTIFMVTSGGLELEEVVLSASKWNQVSSKIPSSIHIISPKEIALQNPQTAADLLGISGKVFIQKSQQGGGSPMIRGFATNRLIYTIDGVRMNTAIFRGGNLQNVISLDPFAIEKAEVFFGPGSLIYGSDAIGGVMSFQTLTPQLSLNDNPFFEGKALFRFANSNHEKTGHFDINAGWKKWAMLTSISSNDFGNLRMGSYGPEEYLRPLYVQRINHADAIITNTDTKVQTPSGYSQTNMMQKLRFIPNDKWDLQYGFHYSTTSSYARYDRHIRYKNGLPRYGEWDYGPQKWMMNNLNIAHTGQNSVYDQLTLRLAQQSFEESRITRDIYTSDREIRVEKVAAYSVNMDFAKKLIPKNNLFYGIEAVWNRVTSTGTNENIDTGIKQPGPTRYPQSTWASYGLYVSNQFQVSKTFLLQVGVRYNRFKLDAQFDTSFYPFPFTVAQLNHEALTGSIGFVFRPTKKWVISSNLATAFRAPNVDDIGKVFDSEPGSVVVPNPDLVAEYAYNVDVSIAKVFGESVKFDITGFYTYLKNALVRRNFRLNGEDSILYDGMLSQVQAIQNAAVARVYGLQTGVEIKLPIGFGISSDFNYQVGREELDDGTTSPSRHAAPWFGVTRLIYKAHQLNLQFYTLYSGKKAYKDLPEEEKEKVYIYAQNSDGKPYSPSWYTLNFKALYQFTHNLTVSAGLENITDQRYRPYSSGIAAPGRNFILTMKFIF